MSGYFQCARCGDAPYRKDGDGVDTPGVGWLCWLCSRRHKAGATAQHAADNATAPVRLNLGCGPDVRPGWVNIDPQRWPGWPAEPDSWHGPWHWPYIAQDPPALPFEDATFDGVVSHHVLQHVPWLQLVPWLAEVHRVLKPGGWLRLSVPDVFQRALAAYDLGDRAWFPISPEHEPSIDGALCLYVSQAGATRSVFTDRWLRELVHRVPHAHEPGAKSCPPPWSLVSTSPVPDDGVGPDWLRELDASPDRSTESIYLTAAKR